MSEPFEEIRFEMIKRFVQRHASKLSKTCAILQMRIITQKRYHSSMYEHDSPYHRIRVIDKDGVRLMRFERNQQSSMRLDDPFESDIEYVDYLHLTMAVVPAAARTLVVGLGGGSVVKRMWRDYPRMYLDAVEIDEEVVDVAREFFALPDDERISVFIEDGRTFVQRTGETYDIIIIDAFDEDRIPRPLLTEEFMRLCRDRLSPGGVIAYNVIGSAGGTYSKPFRSLYRTAGNVWPRLWVFPIGSADDMSAETRNIILLATASELSTDGLLERIAGRVDSLVTVRKFERFGEDLHPGNIRSGDVPLIVDHQASKRGKGRSRDQRRK